MPSFKELDLLVGSKVRLNSGFLLDARSNKEKFMVKEAPAHGNSGLVILEGLLSSAIITIGTEENVILEVVD